MSGLKYEVQTRFYDGDWLNVWMEEHPGGEPVRTFFGTPEEAQAAIDEFIQDTKDSPMADYDPDDYRVNAVPA
jgi:hypothetical protein